MKYHLVEQMAMMSSIEHPRHDFGINAIGSHNVLEAVRRHSHEGIVLCSSTNKVYGDLNWVNETETRYVSPEPPSGFEEEIPLDFHGPSGYRCSKSAVDQ